MMRAHNFCDTGGDLCAVLAVRTKCFEVLGGGNLVKVEPESALVSTHVTIWGEIVGREYCKEGG